MSRTRTAIRGPIRRRLAESRETNARRTALATENALTERERDTRVPVESNQTDEETIKINIKRELNISGGGIDDGRVCINSHCWKLCFGADAERRKYE